MNRREFLASGSATLASATLFTSAGIEWMDSVAIETKNLFSAGNLCRASFAQCIDSSFQLHHMMLGPIDLKLVNLIDGPSAKGHEQFSLLFQAPGTSQLERGTYVMAHADSGYFPLYLDSAGNDAQGPLFRADFNLTTA